MPRDRRGNDELTDLNCTLDHLNGVRGPKTLLLYGGELHGLGDTRSSLLGSPYFPFIADWLADRAVGRSCESESIVVDQNGQMHVQPYGDARTYQYGAALGIDLLFGNSPATGMA